MGLFQRIASFFSGAPPKADSRFLPVYLYSNRCREPIAGRFDLMNDPSAAEEGEGLYARKVFHTSGKGRCFGEVEVQIWLDAKRALVRHEVTGGRWLTAEEYANSVAEQVERERLEHEAAELARAEQPAPDAPEETPPDASQNPK